MKVQWEMGGVADGQLEQRTFAAPRVVRKAMVELLGASCDVVLHDVSDHDSSIVPIEGSATRRRVGGPFTDSGLGGRLPSRGHVYNYTTVGEGGRVFKSASVLLSDAQGEAVGVLCINLDVTPYLAFHQHLQTLLRAVDGVRPV